VQQGQRVLVHGAAGAVGQALLVLGRLAGLELWGTARAAHAARFCFAGLWRPVPDGADDAFTLLTTEPGPDVALIHDRQMVVLDRPDWMAWLDLTRPESDLLRPLPAGSLAVEQVR
jgi:putative SOS response-associated peptidase YedK